MLIINNPKRKLTISIGITKRKLNNKNLTIIKRKNLELILESQKKALKEKRYY